MPSLGLHAVAVFMNDVLGSKETPMAWSGSVMVCVPDSTLTNARLLGDQGNGFIDIGLSPSMNTAGTYFMTQPLAPYSRYQVSAIKQGQPMTSNIMTVSTAGPTLTITAPQTSHDPNNIPLIQAPTTISWASAGSSGYMIFLTSRHTSGSVVTDTMEWQIEIPASQLSYTLGGAALNSYLKGPTPLTSATQYSVTVVGFDATGFATATSIDATDEPLWFQTQ